LNESREGSEFTGNHACGEIREGNFGRAVGDEKLDILLHCAVEHTDTGAKAADADEFGFGVFAAAPVVVAQSDLTGNEFETIQCLKNLEQEYRFGEIGRRSVFECHAKAIGLGETIAQTKADGEERIGSGELHRGKAVAYKTGAVIKIAAEFSIAVERSETIREQISLTDIECDSLESGSLGSFAAIAQFAAMGVISLSSRISQWENSVEFSKALPLIAFLPAWSRSAIRTAPSEASLTAAQSALKASAFSSVSMS
jgi:hypothetical protein